ncbi:hypothetical protein H8K35_10365 [Undibacterium sp. LX40W]|uniref:Uncharacterized protein n=1 Tax=Undibacterium nitidum TaxID=2762298 RepID=A0A923KT60_9BURK|nr:MULTISPECIES: hypothetical protein [Undibacterium]MBC3881941.1 hypothetical protein [Undibacterium nitidum]MBC3892062.1 hypothetical protein [Undibacterium sp. LX40W]
MAGFPIPSDFPLNSFIGQEVTQICIGSQHVRINFYKRMMGAELFDKWEKGAAIDIESGYELWDLDRCTQKTSNEDLGEKSGCLTVLLGQVITAFEKLPDNEIVFRFSNGNELKLLTDKQGFESYQLNLDGNSVDITKNW